MLRDECMLLLGYKASRADDREYLLTDFIVLQVVHASNNGLLFAEVVDSDKNM